MLASGCGRTAPDASLPPTQVLRLGNGAEPRTIDPATAETESEDVIATALFEGLVNLANDGTTILPGVAERWEIAPDGLTYRFHLRSAARWSDGSPVTADDFEYAFRRVFTPSLGAENNVSGFAIAGAQALSEGKAATLGVAAIDPWTLVIHLDYPCPYLLSLLAFPPFDPVPRRVVERFGDGLHPDAHWTLPGNLVGNGPFMLKTWRPNQAVVVVRNPSYWDHQRVQLSQIAFFPTDDLDAEERAFRSGQLDVTYQLPPSKIAPYRRQGGGVLRIAPQLNTAFLLFNTAAAPFRDVRVRRALALAIDRDMLVPAVGQGAFTPAHSLTRPGTGGYTPPVLPDYDPERARPLLAEAGYPAGHGFPHITVRVPTGPCVPLAEAIQEAWRRNLGIELGISVQEQKVCFEALKTKDYSVALMSFFYGVDAPETMLLVAQGDSMWNWSGWRDAAFDRAYRAATTSLGEATRHQAYDAMERAVHDQAPLAPIAFLNQPHLVSPAVRGWRDNPLYAIDWRELSIRR